MERRKFVTAIGSLAAGSAAVMGSGAFSNASASRTASVDVVGDQNAYLQLTPLNETYARTSDGTLELNFAGGWNENAEGLNQEAVTTFHDLFEIKNGGTENVGIFIDDDGHSESGWSVSGYPDGTLNSDLVDEGLLTYHNSAGFFTDDGDITNVEEYAPTDRSPDDIGQPNSTAHVLGPGDSVNVSWYIDTREDEGYSETDIGSVESSVGVWAFSKDFAQTLQE